MHRLKNGSLILFQFALFIFLLLPKICNSQPGAHGGFLNFKLYNKGELINLPNKEWNVRTANITLADSTNTENYLLPNKKMHFST